MIVHPWPPIVSKHSRILILGTMPSPASLRDNFYYGHPRNAFWGIMGVFFGAERTFTPAERAAILNSHGIALWDVLQACTRPGALDADIRDAKPQDFIEFLAHHPRIHTVLFNGKAAADLWNRLVAPQLPGHMNFRLRTRTLPSTSPAHARPFEEKLDAWRQALDEAARQDLTTIG